MIYSRKTDLACDIAMRFFGEPYIWGGDDPLAGFDCSGLVIEVLKSAGILPRDGDWTAAGLFEKFVENTTNILSEGCLVFWGVAGKITHVEMVVYKVGDECFTIGASGGGSKTLSREDAIKQNAYIKVRPVKPGWIEAVNPFWGE